LTQILVETSLVDSISAARRAIKEGGVYLNNQKVEDEAAEITDFIHGQFAILRRGKKTLAGIIKA
jgi:tyrosyl-tRNA synthetase